MVSRAVVAGREHRDARRLIHHLKRLREFRHQRRRAPETARRRRRLTRWQSARIARTHADLLRHPRSGPAIRYFLDHLYAPADFSQRERELERIAPILARSLPRRHLHNLAISLEMNVLTEELDGALLGVLTEELGADEITEETYLEAFRRCDDRHRRQRQVELLGEVGNDLDDVVNTVGAYTALRWSRAPARLAGLGELQQFLERGFRVFREVRGAGEFMRTIVARERMVLERIYARHPHPFDVEAT